jgi:hypothetical protein
MATKLDSLEVRVGRNEKDINAQGGKIEDYNKTVNQILVAITALPTKADYQALTNEVKDCVGVERKRIDSLYTRDMWGTLIVGVIGVVGLALSIIAAAPK